MSEFEKGARIRMFGFLLSMTLSNEAICGWVAMDRYLLGYPYEFPA